MLMDSVVILGLASAAFIVLWSALRSFLINYKIAPFGFRKILLWIVTAITVLEAGWVLSSIFSQNLIANVAASETSYASAQISTAGKAVLAGKFSLAAQFTVVSSFFWSDGIKSGKTVKGVAAQRRYLGRLGSYVTLSFATFYFGLFSILTEISTKLASYSSFGPLGGWEYTEWVEHGLHFIEHQEGSIAIVAIGIGLFGVVDAVTVTGGDIDESASDTIKHLDNRIESLQQALQVAPQANVSFWQKMFKRNYL